jgi:hypothetical protein
LYRRLIHFLFCSEELWKNDADKFSRKGAKIIKTPRNPVRLFLGVFAGNKIFVVLPGGKTRRTENTKSPSVEL